MLNDFLYEAIFVPQGVPAPSRSIIELPELQVYVRDFGGGEALLHAEFIRRFRDLCHEDWHISVETSLAVAPEALTTVLGAVDEYIVDCKDLNHERYTAYTGGDAVLMETNLRQLLSSVSPDRVLVRVPLIPGFNTPEDQAENAAALQKMGAVRLDLFSYVIPKNPLQISAEHV